MGSRMSEIIMNEDNGKSNLHKEEDGKSGVNLEKKGKSATSGSEINSNGDGRIGNGGKYERGETDSVADRLNSNFTEYSSKMPEPKSGESTDDVPTLDLDELPPDVKEYAKWEIGETEEVKCQTLHELREMIYEQGECLPHRMDDDHLIKFLRARSFNVCRAYRLLLNYYNFKEENPNVHQNVHPMKLRHIGDDDVVIVPSYRTQCGRRLIIFRIGNWDPRKYSVEDIFKAIVIILELGTLETRAQILGGVVVFDLQGINMSHAWAITPRIANMVLALMVYAFPMKTYAIHIVNQSWVFDAIFAVFKPLIDSRMKSKIYFHGHDMESLHKHISPGNLPKKYGGSRDEFSYHKWLVALAKLPIVIKELQQLGYIITEEELKNLDD